MDGFTVAGIDISVNDRDIVVNNKEISFTIEDFNRIPRVVMQDIIRHIL